MFSKLNYSTSQAHSFNLPVMSVLFLDAITIVRVSDLLREWFLNRFFRVADDDDADDDERKVSSVTN